MVTTNNNTEMITWMNATSKLSLEPFLFKPLLSKMQTCKSAVPTRIPQCYFQSLLSSVSLSWIENKKIGNVLCCISTRHTPSYMRSWLIFVSFKPPLFFLFLCPLLLPLLHFSWANWQQQSFKGDKQLCYLGIVRFQRINSSCSCCLLFEATLQPIISEKIVQRWKCRTVNEDLVGE